MGLKTAQSFGHALGLAHEHSHPDFAKKLDVNTLVELKMVAKPHLNQAEAVEIITKQSFQKVNPKTQGYTPLYDPDSVMLYSLSSNQTKDGVQIVGGQVFSAMDKAQLKKMYP